MSGRWTKIFALILTVVIVAGFIVLNGCASKEKQVNATDFYKENTVTLVSPYAPGGGADLDARLFAAHWSGITGGTMVNINKQAAGGIEGANYIFTAKADGLTLGHGGPSSCMYVPTLMGDKAMKADITKVSWFGALYPTQFLITVGKHIEANNIEELKQVKGLRVGAYAATAAFAQSAALLADIFNLNISIVTGYSNVSEINVAIGKKEIDAMVCETQAYYLEAQKGFIKPPFLIMDFGRSKWYPDVKGVTEITKLTAEQERLLNVLMLTSGQGKAFFGPPNIPVDRVTFLRDAWNKMMESKAFLKQMQELRYPVWEKPLTGEEVAAKAAQVTQMKASYVGLSDLVKRYVK